MVRPRPVGFPAVAVDFLLEEVLAVVGLVTFLVVLVLAAVGLADFFVVALEGLDASFAVFLVDTRFSFYNTYYLYYMIKYYFCIEKTYAKNYF